MVIERPGFQRRAVAITALLWVTIPMAPPSRGGDEPGGEVTQAAKIYRTPQERREAGLRHELTEWLAVQALAEVGWEGRRERLEAPPGHVSEDDASLALQLGFEADLGESLIAEVVLEYDAGDDRSEVDEALLEYERGPWAISLGRLNLGFGEYFSHFVTGPLVEMGETRADALNLERRFGAGAEVHAWLYEGKVRGVAGDRRSTQWGVGFELSNLDESFKLGAGYLSDLAASQEGLLDEAEPIPHRPVAAWNGYLLFGGERYEVTAEVVAAIDRFAALEAAHDRPRAVNLELAWFPRSHFQLAFRAEASREFDGRPREQYGISLAWLIGSRFSLAADYLYGRFAREGGDGDDEEEQRPTAQRQVALQVSFGF